jgi:hypothetical protein
VASCPAEELPRFIATPDKECVVVPDNKDGTTNLTHLIASQRLAGQFDVSRLTKIDDDNWDELTTFAYWVGFGEYCRKCAKLGGFQQF